MGSVNIGLPVSQHRPGVGPELAGCGAVGGPPDVCDAGLTEATAVGLPPGGRTTALVTAILTPSGWCGCCGAWWWAVVVPPEVVLPGVAEALLSRPETGEAEDDVRDVLTVTGH